MYRTRLNSYNTHVHRYIYYKYINNSYINIKYLTFDAIFSFETKIT